MSTTAGIHLNNLPVTGAAPPFMDMALARLHGDSFTYVCPGLESRACRHSVSLLCTLDESSLITVDVGHAVIRAQSVMVAPQVARVLKAAGVPLVLVDLEPLHRQYRRMSGGAATTGVMSLDHLEPFALRDIGNRFFRQTLTGAALDSAVRQAVTQMAQAFPEPPELDERVRWMMSAIDLEPSRSLTDLANALYLTVEYASRLFSNQLGICLRTYSLSSKMRFAARYMGSGNSLTEVAQMAGFVDSAHFAKVWARCYGRPPSAVFHAGKTRMDGVELAHWNRPPVEVTDVAVVNATRPPPKLRPKPRVRSITARAAQYA